MALDTSNLKKLLDDYNEARTKTGGNAEFRQAKTKALNDIGKEIERLASSVKKGTVVGADSSRSISIVPGGCCTMSLGLIVRFLAELEETAEKVFERGGAGADTPETRRSAVSFLEMILSDPEVELSSESRYKMEAYRNHLIAKLVEDTAS